MTYVLTIIFYNALNQPMFLDGWYPLTMKSQEHCEQAQIKAHDYIQSILDDNKLRRVTRFEVLCVAE